MTRLCADCPSPISRQAKRCRSCAVQRVNGCPEVAQARAKAIRMKFTDPAHRAKMQGIILRNAETARMDPAYLARLSERGRQQYANHLNTPESRAASLATRRASGAKRTETVLGWCPPEYRDDYRQIVRARRLTAAEGRKIILGRVSADIANLSPFERQERAILRGAGLVANVRVAR